MNELFCVNEIVGKKDMLAEFGLFASMCISSDGRCLLIGYSDAIVAIDLLTKELIGISRGIKYISSISFFSSDKKVIIGTWTNTHIVDFSELFDL